jgi:hypothetical protein
MPPELRWQFTTRWMIVFTLGVALWAVGFRWFSQPSQTVLAVYALTFAFG